MAGSHRLHRVSIHFLRYLVSSHYIPHTMPHQIILHHLNNSRSDRIFWTLEELNLPYDVQVHFRLPTRSAPPSLHKVSPLGRAPALILDGRLLTESAYIIHTLLSLPEVQQAAQKGEIDVQVENTNDDVFWSHFAEASMMNLLQGMATVGATSQGWLSGKVPGLPELSEDEKKGIQKYSSWVQDGYFRPNIQSPIDFAENFLAKQDAPFFSGTSKPGEGDFMMFFAINSLLGGSRADMGFKVGPNLKKWYDIVLSRPAGKKALERLKQEEESAKAKI
ncbi:glutathione transferase [Cryptococcus neoformans C23]|uniref:Glutathione transferase n=2 Tax=Cryptococcus neoformans TaxID=5207 RepID=A0A854QBX0_CRYNE|nr:glutathione transferase [Cryptococcus neoformans var. grubii AD2-60a]OWZ43333.1 glutathione transferase [Cryptococcus neoformans var. grubii AD1-83a]OWZ43878.1 glutathione transferase [Cryptococcus neoformans var. grubii C23]OWZ54617.1 glutathione transferase [Cryptococcus neoformans var. grubii 125.91]OWZ78567.1 glutathione transferase [Cryptococcus neoformans var. grubii Bt85]OXC84611.1 glutathione transferase [Cryptococcus neoformans var. grubii AD1-7a]OXG21291.1 glutathione transferase